MKQQGYAPSCFRSPIIVGKGDCDANMLVSIDVCDHQSLRQIFWPHRRYRRPLQAFGSLSRNLQPQLGQVMPSSVTTASAAGLSLEKYGSTSPVIPVPWHCWHFSRIFICRPSCVACLHDLPEPWHLGQSCRTNGLWSFPSENLAFDRRGNLDRVKRRRISSFLVLGPFHGTRGAVWHGLLGPHRHLG